MAECLVLHVSNWTGVTGEDLSLADVDLDTNLDGLVFHWPGSLQSKVTAAQGIRVGVLMDAKRSQLRDCSALS